MDYSEVSDPGAFAALARELAITTVILAWQEEYGQIPDQALVNYERLRLITLLAYHPASGRIVRCQLRGGAAQRADLRRDLAAQGFTVEERSRNIVGFNT